MPRTCTRESQKSAGDEKNEDRICYFRRVRADPDLRDFQRKKARREHGGSPFQREPVIQCEVYQCADKKRLGGKRFQIQEH